MRYTDAEIQKCIKSGLMAYKENAKLFYRNYPSVWKKMSLSQKVAAARAWVYMSHVAKEPKLYLAPEYTLADWRARAYKYTKENNLQNMSAAYLIVPGPKEIVENNAGGAVSEPYFSADFSNKYYNFLKMIQDYEYADRSWIKEKEAESIVAESKRIKKVLESNKTPWWYVPAKVMGDIFRSGNSK